MAQKNQQASIIEIIQKMVRDGETEETIVKTLKELGVSPQQAKRLLLLGEADTYALISSDLSKIVRANIEQEKEELKQFLNEQVQSATGGTEKKIITQVITDLQQYEKDIESDRKNFQEQMNQTVEKSSFLSERVKEKLNELGSALRQVQIDMDELKLRGIASRHKYISSSLIILGIAFAIVDIFLLIDSFQTTVASTDSLIIMVVIAMISISMLFVATII